MLIYLENIYLCGVNNNDEQFVGVPALYCDLLENIYLCGINNNCRTYVCTSVSVVICLKISTFVVSTTTSKAFWKPST